MSGQLRELKNRIRSVENTKKITRAMEMVAAAKLRRFQTMMLNARPYTEGLASLVRRLNEADRQKGSGGLSHPFFEAREPNRIALVVMTSDTGLCGSFNGDLVSLAERFLREHEPVSVIAAVGKNGALALQRARRPVSRSFLDIPASKIDSFLKEFEDYLENLYTRGEADAIYVVYSHFLTTTTYQGVVEKLLPLDTPGNEHRTSGDTDYIFEPGREIIFEKLVPLFFKAKVRTIYLESLVSEQIARMNAMHQATKNASEMIDSLVLLRNKMRQAAITKELIEIVSGSRALKLK
jgi:F-type H+-transporting ATPase subunit gamma